jgi:hypothetical protein
VKPGLLKNKGGIMKRIAFLVVAVATMVGAAAYMAVPSGQAGEEASPIYGVTIPPGYRDWKLISVTHEEGDFRQLRAQLGNDIAIKAYREGKLPFPDGAILVALHCKRVPRMRTTKSLAVYKLLLPGPP